MGGQGHRAFVDELQRFAARVADARCAVIAERLAAPLRIAVSGRRGVGRRTVARALAVAGIEVSPSPNDADADIDLEVYVLAEVVKPEDRAAIAAARHRVLAVLNKADLTPATGVPAQPMVALLAVAALDEMLDDTRWDALHALAARAADLSSPDSFLTGTHPVPVGTRRELLDTLDLFGITRAIAAIGRGESKAQVHALLRRLSRVDTVLDRIAAAGAEVHYRRILGAVAGLEALAVTERWAADFLTRDDTVIARMTAAADVVEQAGLPVERCRHRSAYLDRAVRWRRYSRGPVSAVQRAAGADIARGSLRLWSPSSDRTAP
jgi:hypothetical protein